MDDTTLEFVGMMGSTVRATPVVVRGHLGHIPGLPSIKQQYSMYIFFDASVTERHRCQSHQDRGPLPKENVPAAEEVSLLASVDAQSADEVGPQSTGVPTGTEEHVGDHAVRAVRKGGVDCLRVAWQDLPGKQTAALNATELFGQISS